MARKPKEPKFNWDFSEFIDEMLAKQDDDSDSDHPIVHADCGFGDSNADQ